MYLAAQALPRLVEYTPVVMRILRFTYASSIRRAVVAGGSYKTTCMFQNKHEVEAGASQLAVACTVRGLLYQQETFLAGTENPLPFTHKVDN